jgi:hypothetical protein
LRKGFCVANRDSWCTSTDCSRKQQECTKAPISVSFVHVDRPRSVDKVTGDAAGAKCDFGQSEQM